MEEVAQRQLRQKIEQMVEAYRDESDGRDTIYVIESPSPEDLLAGRHEGETLSKILKLAEIDVVYYLTANAEMFDQAFDNIEQAIFSLPDFPTAMPFIHISGHGGDDGLELTDGDVIYWEKLHNRLERLHKSLGPLAVPPIYNQNVPKASVCL